MSHLVAWGLYDWANSAFATTVLAGFFPIFFKSYWCAGLSATQSTSRLGFTHAAASILAALLALFIGVYAAHPGRFRLAFRSSVIGGVCATSFLAVTAEGAWLTASVLCIIAQLGFSASLVCYDSLLPTVSRGRSAERISALGYSLGYLGGGLQFLLCVALYRWPGAFGLDSSFSAVRASFLLVSIWWILFSLPILVAKITPEVNSGAIPEIRPLQALRSSLTGNRAAVLFLLAYWIYIDGVNSVVKMALDYGMAKGLAPSDLITALLVTQFVGFPATIVFGLIGAKIGAKRAVLAGLAGYAALTVWGALLQSTWEFYAIAVGVGLLQGGVQSLSRAFFSKLVAGKHTSELFGMFNMVSKFASIIGPVLIAIVSSMTDSHELGILSLLLLFSVGGALLWRVRAETPDCIP